MNFSPDIKEEALSILNKPNVVLPAGIQVGQADPVFFVSEIDDLSIYAHLTIEHEGKNYKIGTEKSLWILSKTHRNRHLLHYYVG